MDYSNAGKRIKAGLAIIISAGLFFGVVPGAWAQSNTENQSSTEGRGQGIEISPPRLELEADPGETITAKIHVRNITDLKVVAQGHINDFVARNEGGEPRILFGDETSSYSLKNYISEVPSLTLPPKKRRTVEIELNVPQDASPGGHFGLVRFSAVPADTGEEGPSQVNLSASIGTLILLNVSGEVKEEMAIEEFFVSKGGEQGELFETGPLTFVTRLRNSGNVHLQPTGSVTVSNMLGQDVGVRAFNENRANVLPDSIRRLEHNLEDKDFWFGRYTATAQLQYGSDDTTLREQMSFWVIPYKFIAIVLVMLVLVIFFGRRALQAYNRSVVRKHQEQQRASGNRDTTSDKSDAPGGGDSDS